MSKYICDINNTGCCGYDKEAGECFTFENCIHKKEKLMTLDETIKCLNEGLIYYYNECVLNHKQLTEWLTELKERRSNDNKYEFNLKEDKYLKEYISYDFTEEKLSDEQIEKIKDTVGFKVYLFNKMIHEFKEELIKKFKK